MVVIWRYQDSHYCCLVCPGIQHAEETFVNGSCSSCGDMTISEFGNVKHGGVPLCLCCDLAFIPAPLPLDRAGTFVEVLMWNPPPRTPIIRGWTSGFSVPFFPEVHEELTRSWKAPFTARNKSCGPSPPLMVKPL